VLHGASGVPKDVVREAIAGGIAIINIDTDLRLAFSTALRQAVVDLPSEIDPRKLMKPVITAVQEAAKQKLKEFNTQPLPGGTS
jgi:fructose-bisphosphate aldolase class II